MVKFWGIQKTRLCKVFENQQLIKSLVCLGREPETGGYSVFLVAIEGFVYQDVEFTQRYIQIMNGKCDQMRPK